MYTHKDYDRFHDMVADAFLKITTTIADEITLNVEEPNLEQKCFMKC